MKDIEMTTEELIDYIENSKNDFILTVRLPDDKESNDGKE